MLLCASLSLSVASVVALMPLRRLQDSLQQRPSGYFEEKKSLLLTVPGNYKAHLRPHSEVPGREGDSMGGGSAFTEADEGGGLGFLGLTLYWGM